MTSPHDRDGKFYGLNEDPYTRSPYVDPTTGYPPTQSFARQADYLDRDNYPAPAPAARTQSRPSTNRRIGLFLGGITAIAVCAMIAAYIGAVVVGVLYRRLGEHGYWLDHQIPAPPQPATEMVLAVAVVAVLVAGSVMWLMTLAVPMPTTFFTVFGMIVSLLVIVWLLQSGDLAVTAPLAIATAIVSIGIVLGVAMCGKTLVAGTEMK